MTGKRMGLEAELGEGAAGWSSRRRAAYGAAAAALSYAAVSLYWALGGAWGVDTLGGEIARLAEARDPTIVAAWTAAVLKAMGGVLALALVQQWGRRLPRRLLFAVASTGAVLLTTYGAVQTISVLLIHLDVVDVAPPAASRVILWRLLLWEPWFLVWGLLLGTAVSGSTRRGRRRRLGTG